MIRIIHILLLCYYYYYSYVLLLLSLLLLLLSLLSLLGGVHIGGPDAAALAEGLLAARGAAGQRGL